MKIFISFTFKERWTWLDSVRRIHLLVPMSSWWPSTEAIKFTLTRNDDRRRRRSQTRCDTQIDLKASRSLQPSLHINSLHIKTRPHSCYGSWGFAAKGRISSSKSNTCRSLLFSAHKFFLAVSFVHRGGDLLLITSSTSSNWRNHPIFICLRFLLSLIVLASDLSAVPFFGN